MAKCIYCGGEANSKDHIPPKCLFVQRRGINFITVPSCERCNGSRHLDDEIFRNFLVNMTTEKSLTATALLHTKIKRSIISRPDIGRKAMEKMKLINYYRKGIYLGKKTLIKVDESDWQRYYRVLNNIIEALFYCEFKFVIPPEFKIEHRLGNNELTSKIRGLLKLLKWRVIDRNVFVYGFGNVDSTPASVWVTEYYKNIYFISFVLDKKFNPEEFINKKEQN